MLSGHWTSIFKQKKITAFIFAMVLTVVGYQNCNPMLFEGNNLNSFGGPGCEISFGASDFRVETKSSARDWEVDSWGSISPGDQLRVTLLEQHQSQFLPENIKWALGLGNPPVYQDNGNGFQATWSTGLSIGAYVLRIEMGKGCGQVPENELSQQVIEIPFSVVDGDSTNPCEGFESLAYRVDPTRAVVGTNVMAQFHGSPISASCARATRFDFGNGILREQESQLSALASYVHPGLYMTRGDLYRPNLSGALERRGYQEVLVVRQTSVCDYGRDLVLRAPSVVSVNSEFMAFVDGPEICLQHIQGVRFHFSMGTGQPNPEDMSRPFENNHVYGSPQLYTIVASVRGDGGETVELRHQVTAVSSTVCSVAGDEDFEGASLSGPTALELTSSVVVGSYFVSIPDCLLPSNFQPSSIVWRLSREGVPGQVMLGSGGFSRDVSFEDLGVYTVSASFSSTAGPLVLSRRVVVFRNLNCPSGSTQSGLTCLCDVGDYDPSSNQCVVTVGASCRVPPANTASFTAPASGVSSLCTNASSSSAVTTNPSSYTWSCSGSSGSVSCSAPRCSGADTIISNNQCVTCSVGQIPNSTRTGCVSCGANQIENPAGTCTTCPNGQSVVNNQCVVTVCANGAVAPACTLCPSGQGFEVNGQCSTCAGGSVNPNTGLCHRCGSADGASAVPWTSGLTPPQPNFDGKSLCNQGAVNGPHLSGNQWTWSCPVSTVVGQFVTCARNIQGPPNQSCGSQPSAGPCEIKKKCENGVLLGSQVGVTLNSIINPSNQPVAHGGILTAPSFSIPGYQVVRAEATFRCENGSFRMDPPGQLGYCEVIQQVPNTTPGCGGGSEGGGGCSATQCEFDGQLIDAATNCCGLLNEPCDGQGPEFFVRTYRCRGSGTSFRLEQNTCGRYRVQCR